MKRCSICLQQADVQRWGARHASLVAIITLNKKNNNWTQSLINFLIKELTAYLAVELQLECHKATQQPEALRGLWGYFILDTCLTHKSLPPLCLFLLHFFFFFLRKNSSWTYLCWCFIVTTELKIALVAVVWFAAFVPSFLEQRESEEMIRGQWSHGNPPHMGSTPEQNCRITRRRILSAGSTDLAGKSIPRLRQSSVNLIPCTLLESRIIL